MGACKPFSVLVGTDDQRHGILVGGVGRKVNREVRALSYKVHRCSGSLGCPLPVSCKTEAVAEAQLSLAVSSCNSIGRSALSGLLDHHPVLQHHPCPLSHQQQSESWGKRSVYAHITPMSVWPPHHLREGKSVSSRCQRGSGAHDGQMPSTSTQSTFV